MWILGSYIMHDVLMAPCWTHLASDDHHSPTLPCTSKKIPLCSPPWGTTWEWSKKKTTKWKKTPEFRINFPFESHLEQREAFHCKPQKFQVQNPQNKGVSHKCGVTLGSEGVELPDPGCFRHWKFSWVHGEAKKKKSVTEKTIKTSRNCVQFRKSQRQEPLLAVRGFDGSLSIHSSLSFGIGSFRKWDIVWGGGLGWPVLMVLCPKSPKIPGFGERSSRCQWIESGSPAAHVSNLTSVKHEFFSSGGRRCSGRGF